MTDIFTTEQHEVMERWLDDNGYGTYEAWAADSDYTAHGEAESDTLHWMDEHGNYVDIRLCLWHAIEAAKEWDCQGCGSTYSGDWPWGGYCRERSCQDAYRAEYGEDYNDYGCEYVKVSA